VKKFKDYVYAVRYSLNTCRKNKKLFIPEMIVIAIVSLCLPLLLNYLSKYIIDCITRSVEAEHFLKTLILWIAIILCLKVMSGIAQYYYSKENRYLRCDVAQRINHLRMSVPYEITLDHNYQNKLSIARSVMDRSVPCVVGIQDATITLFSNIISIGIYMSIILKLHWSILVLYLGVYLTELLINLKHINYSRKFRDKLLPLQRKTAYLAGRSGDIRSAKDIRIYDMSKWFSQKYDNFNYEKAETINRRETIHHRNRVINQFLALFRSTASYIVLLLMFCGNKIAISDFVFYISVVTTFSAVLSGLQGNIQTIYNNYLEVNDYIDFENLSNQSAFVKECRELPQDIMTIEFVDVTYKYPGSEHVILNHINLMLRKNEKVGLVGLNGAGKTTLVLLMCGLLQPTGGTILLNGVNIANYNRNQYISLFSALFQEISVLPDNVLNNIGLQESYSDEQFERIKNITCECGLQNIELNDNLIREIFDDAICLSGGEMQKLALARAIYKSASVLILDEPTASLDPLSEQQLYLNYGRFSDGKISIFISHRLASTAFCDRIIMLENGEIIESGSHLQLMDKKGKYRDLFETQRDYYKKKSMEEDCL
jgi:ABC transporter related